VSPTSRFLRSARDSQWTPREAAKARAGLARQAALARRQLAEQRAARTAEASADARSRPIGRGRTDRRRLAVWLLAPLTVLVVLALLGSALPVASQTRNAPSRASIEEMHRLIEVAREAGLTDEQIRQITIEDEFGNVINAWDYLQELDKRKEVELARREEEQNRVYLTPQDIFRELRARERPDLDQLRDRLPFDRERYR
jgi:hypothetical protein